MSINDGFLIILFGSITSPKVTLLKPLGLGLEIRHSRANRREKFFYKGKKENPGCHSKYTTLLFYSGYVVPSHGVIHVGYDNKESVKEEYEVLCEDQPCSLRYLASKKIRDQIFERERFLNSRYSTKIVNMLLAVEKVFASIIRKVEFLKDFFWGLFRTS